MSTHAGDLPGDDGSLWRTPISFARYLDAKATLDAASLVPGLLDRALDALAGPPPPSGGAPAGGESRRCPSTAPAGPPPGTPLHVLELGAGTGAGLVRLLDALERRGQGLRVVVGAIDRDPALLRRARERLLDRGAAPPGRNGDLAPVTGNGGALHWEVRFLCRDLLTLAPGGDRWKGPRPRLVLAHALMDVLPLEPVCALVKRLLVPGGLFLPTLTYDGLTRLSPPDADPGLEAAILAAYDRSMEARRIGGAPTGGALAGRRLGGVLERLGFEIVGRGASPWRIDPGRMGAHREEGTVAAFLVQTIAGECRRSSGLDPARVAAWARRRLAAIARGGLGLEVAHLDLLARSPEAEGGRQR